MGTQANFETEGTYTPDNLIAGCGDDIRGEKITLISGAGSLVRGTLLGRINDGAVTAVGAAGTPAPAAATITASPTASTAAKAGVHTFLCVVGGSGTASKWEHRDPDGVFIGTATGNTAYSGGGISGLTITDAGTDPTAGEQFKVTVSIAAGSGKYKKSLAAATDGSETPIAILAEDADATSGDADAIAYYTGDFNSDAMTFGTGHTAANTKDALRARGIFLHTPVSA